MTKTTKSTKARKTRAATDDVKSATSNPIDGTSRRTDAALRPATPLEIMVSRALDQELDWFFSYAEAAMHRESVRMLPSYAAIPILATEPTEEAFRARGLEIAATVKRCLVTVRGKHAEVLRTAYTPRAWPKGVEKAFQGVAAIAVRLAFADDPWPERLSRTGLEQAAAARLDAAITAKSIPVGRHRSQAERMLGSAIVAYAGARSLQPSSMGGR